MASAIKTEAVTEVVVVKSAEYTLTLTEEEAIALRSLLGSTVSKTWWEANAPWSSVYSALESVIDRTHFWKNAGHTESNSDGIKYYPKKKN